MKKNWKKNSWILKLMKKNCIFTRWMSAMTSWSSKLGKELHIDELDIHIYKKELENEQLDMHIYEKELHIDELDIHIKESDMNFFKFKIQKNNSKINIYILITGFYNLNIKK